MKQIVEAADAIEEAASVLSHGGLVAVPTETVYGLAADASNGAAVARIFEAKGRPRFNPLIAHVADMAMAKRLAIFDPLSERLASHFWPGPLTLVLPRQADAALHPLVSAGLDTVALRMPRGFAHELIARFGRPIAAPSANSSGRISTTTAAAVAIDLGERVDLIVDGGATSVGLESTIVKVEDGKVRLLRPGGVSVEELEAMPGISVLRASKVGIEAPGQMESHYAPVAAMRLNVERVEPGEALLAFGSKRAANASNAVVAANLSKRGDLREAAANLFVYMAQLDRAGAATIAVEPIPVHGLGEAINDRLRRAAAPRPGGI